MKPMTMIIENMTTTMVAINFTWYSSESQLSLDDVKLVQVEQFESLLSQVEKTRAELSDMMTLTEYFFNDLSQI